MCTHVNTHIAELLDHMCVCPYWLADASKSNMDPQGTGNLLLYIAVNVRIQLRCRMKEFKVVNTHIIVHL